MGVDGGSQTVMHELMVRCKARQQVRLLQGMTTGAFAQLDNRCVCAARQQVRLRSKITCAFAQETIHTIPCIIVEARSHVGTLCCTRPLIAPKSMRET